MKKDSYDEEEQHQESDPDNSEVIESMSLEEQEKFVLYLTQKMDLEIAKVKEKYIPKIKEIEKRIEERKPKPTTKVLPTNSKRLEQNL